MIGNLEQSHSPSPSTVTFSLNPIFFIGADLDTLDPVRGRHPDLPFGESDGFIHNSLHYATAHFRIDASTPVSEIAYRNRQAINQALNEEDIDIGMSVTREMVRRGQPIHICEPFERFYSISNWCGAWKGLDFRGAVAVKGPELEERTLLDVDMLVVGQGNKPGAPRRCKWPKRWLP
jgi:hypothetical protein